MQLRERLSNLLSDTRIVERTNYGVIRGLQNLLENVDLSRSGRSLSLQLLSSSVGCQMMRGYLEGIPEEDILQGINTPQRTETGLEPLTSRGMWSYVCGKTSSVCRHAVTGVQHLRLPRDVREGNLRLGKTDVLELPHEIAYLAEELLDNGSEISKECAIILVHCIAVLFSVITDEEFTMSISNSSFWRLHKELVTSVALYLLGVCPSHRLPRTLLSEVISKREKELSRI